MSSRRSGQFVQKKQARFAAAMAVGSPRSLLDPYVLASALTSTTMDESFADEDRREASALPQSFEEREAPASSGIARIPPESFASYASFGETSVSQGDSGAFLPASCETMDSEAIFGKDSFQRAREAEALRNLVRSTTPKLSDDEPAIDAVVKGAYAPAIADDDVGLLILAASDGDSDDEDDYGFFLDMDGDEAPPHPHTFLPDHLASRSRPIDIPT